MFDYLAEITMSILARARAADPSTGYAADFVSAALAPNLNEIARRRVRIVSNAGGINPAACGAAVRALIDRAGLDLKVAVISGDDLSARAADFAAARAREMFSGAPFPKPDSVASINAYLGAFPIAAALDAGADIVITGRVVDSAVTLGACIHRFGWAPRDYDRLAGGSLAGHLLECSTQATGGNFTDWHEVADSLAAIGCPIAEIDADGTFALTKPAGTGGAVTVGTVSEQMLYEIEDPQAYALPDAICDFSAVTVASDGPDRVRVAGARGTAPSGRLKVSATWADGYRGGAVMFFYGEAADRRARAYADQVLARAARGLEQTGLGPVTEALVEVIGDESHYGAFRAIDGAREVALKIGARHPRAEGVGVVLREIAGGGLAAPPGLCGFAGAGRPKPSPVVRLFSFLVPQADVGVEIALDGAAVPYVATPPPASTPKPPERPPSPRMPADAGELIEVPLVRLAWGRSGDKGNRANVGIIARDPAYLPWIWQALPEEFVARRFAHFLKGPVERFLLPGAHAINFVLNDVLGGGGIASLRNDPQGKGYAQLLLAAPIPVPRALAESLG